VVAAIDIDMDAVDCPKKVMSKRIRADSVLSATAAAGGGGATDSKKASTGRRRRRSDPWWLPSHDEKTSARACSPRASSRAAAPVGLPPPVPPLPLWRDVLPALLEAPLPEPFPRVGLGVCGSAAPGGGD